MPKTTKRKTKTIQQLGGEALAAKLTPEQRSASARRAVKARWRKVRAERKAAKAAQRGAAAA